MASEFTIPLTAEGAVTAPSGSFTFIEPSAKSQTFLDVGPVNVLEIPEFGWMLADGVNPLRVVTRSAVYDCGGIAPNVSMTLAVTGATRATVVGTYTGLPTNAQQLQIGAYPEQPTITFLDTLAPNTGITQVKIAATADDTYTNFYKLMNGTGTQGVEYWDAYLELASVLIKDGANIEASALDTTGNTITLRYRTYGTFGNTAISVELGGGVSNFSFASVTFTGGVVGTGTSPLPGTRRYFYTWYRDADGAETGRSPITSITTEGNFNIDVSGLTASADTTFDYIRIYRTTNLGVEFYLCKTIPRASSSFTDSLSDTTLATIPPWNDLLHRDYTEGMPPRGRALAYWKNRVWSLGAHLHAEYTKGTVAVVGITTTPSATITFSVKGVTTLMRNMTFQVDATSEVYTILSVDETNRTAVLDRTYAGADNATATFKIMDDYDASRMRACVPGLYNQWPVDESPGRVDTDDAEGGTALLATTSKLFGFSPTSIVAVTGDDQESWAISKISDGVGCVAPRMVVAIGDGGVFLSQDGFYAISPDGFLTCISTPKANKKAVATGIDDTVARINWSAVDQGYAIYDIDEGTVVFGLPLDGATTTNYEIVFDLQNSTWTTFKRAEWTALAPIVLPGGGHAKLSGDREGNLWHVDIGESDGFYGTEAVQTLTGAQTVRALTVTGTPYSTSGDGEKGKPFVVLYADGVTVAFGKVASNTTSVITPAEDLSTAPASGDQIILGAIAWQAKSGFTTFGEEWRAKGLKSVMLRHAPTTRGEYFLSFAVDSGSFNLPPVGTGIGSLALASGKIRHKIQWPGDSHAVNIRGFKPGGRAILRGGVFDLNVRENGRV